MPKRRQLPHSGPGYAFSVAITVLAFTTQYVFRDILGDFSPFLPLLGAIMMAAWYGGLWPGIMATVLGGILAIWFFAPPNHASLLETAGGGAGLFVFLALGVTMSILCEELHAAQRLLEDEQEKARESHAFDEIIAELTSDFAYKSRLESDDSIVVESLSEGFTRLLGYTREEVNAMGGGQTLVHPDDREQLKDIRRRLLAGETIEDEARYVAKDGRVLWLRYRMRPMRDDTGRVVHVYGAASDVTLHKQADLAVRQSEEQLRLADRRKDEFLATLAHELRNPLAPLRNAIEIMQRADNEVLREEALRICERQVRQMVRLIDDLLDVSRITSGKLRLRFEQVDLGEVLRNAVETSRPLIETFGHSLVLNGPTQPIHLHGDPTRLAQIFANLLNNAAKFTPRNGRISLVAERVGDMASITVRDTGVGIPKDMLPHVFDMFTQGEAASHRAPGGLGVGLTIVRLLVEMHGGTVEARSEGPAFGSEFVVRLPAMAAVPNGDELGVAEPLSGTSDMPRRRVLVVEDNEDAARSLAMLLRMTSHEVITAADGLEAMQAVARERPDVVLLDIGLPGLSGYEVARYIREHDWGKDMVLVAMTGWGQLEDKRRSKAAGFDVHLTKPVDPALLERLLADPASIPIEA